MESTVQESAKLLVRMLLCMFHRCHHIRPLLLIRILVVDLFMLC